MLQGRSKHAWGKEIGISKGVIDAMWKGNMPGAEKLVPAINAENMSLTWLVEGSGQPYLVYSSLNDLDAYEYLEALFDEDWSAAYILTDGKTNAIVLTMPGTYFVGTDPTEYKYTVVEIIAGQVGNKAISLLDKHEVIYRLYKKKISSEDMLKINRGQVGTYQLIGKTEAMLDEVEEIQRDKALKVASDTADYETGNDLNDIINDLEKLDGETLASIRIIIKRLVR